MVMVWLIIGCNSCLFGVMCYLVVVSLVFVCEYFVDGVGVGMLVKVFCFVFNMKDVL